MCGRYASSRGADHLVEHFGVDEPVEESVAESVPPSWNVAPTDPTWVVACDGAARVLRPARWGLVPHWAGQRRGRPLINARRETVTTAPAFRAAFARRRCLVPADGYYEWQPRAVDGKHGKQPWYLTSRDGAPLPMAGLYEVRYEDGVALWTCTVLTTAAPDELGEIHDRTPLLVPRADWARWLDPAVAHPGDDLLVPGVAGVLDAWPVGREVGDVRNDGPGLAARVEPDAPAPTLLG